LAEKHLQCYSLSCLRANTYIFCSTNVNEHLLFAKNSFLTQRSWIRALEEKKAKLGNLWNCVRHKYWLSLHGKVIATVVQWLRRVSWSGWLWVRNLRAASNILAFSVSHIFFCTVRNQLCSSIFFFSIFKLQTCNKQKILFKNVIL